jgi:hypothetical protein
LPRRAGMARAPWLLAARIPPYLVLLRVGFTLPPALLPARCALTAPFHPYRCTGQLQRAAHAVAVCFLWHLPSTGPAETTTPASRTLSGTLPCGVRTFLSRRTRFKRLSGSDRPVPLPAFSLPRHQRFRLPVLSGRLRRITLLSCKLKAGEIGTAQPLDLLCTARPYAQPPPNQEFIRIHHGMRNLPEKTGGYPRKPLRILRRNRHNPKSPNPGGSRRNRFRQRRRRRIGHGLRQRRLRLRARRRIRPGRGNRRDGWRRFRRRTRLLE